MQQIQQGGRAVAAPQVTRQLETLPELQAFAGQELGVGEWHEVTQSDVDQFAAVTGDRQFIHGDPAAARQTSFGGTIAHGFLTLSLLPLLGRSLAGVKVAWPHRVSINYGLNKVRFMSPVRIPARVRLRSKLLEVQERGPGLVQLVYGKTVEIEGQSKPALYAETIDLLQQ